MSDLLEARAGDVVHLTLNRPERLNALSEAMTAALRDALTRIAGDAGIGVVMLTGAGRAFCAGGDVQGMRDEAPVPVPERAHALRANAEITRLLAEMPQITIAAVNGAAAGAGLALALACDMRLAGASARFGTAFLRMGLASDMGAAWFLARLLGSAQARRMFLLPEMLAAPAAIEIGLADRLFPDEALLAEATTFARQLAAGPRGAQAEIKQLLAAAATEALSPWLDREARAQARCVASADHREAVQAFIDKRPPVYGLHQDRRSP